MYPNLIWLNWSTAWLRWPLTCWAFYVLWAHHACVRCKQTCLWNTVQFEAPVAVPVKLLCVSKCFKEWFSISLSSVSGWKGGWFGGCRPWVHWGDGAQQNSCRCALLYFGRSCSSRNTIGTCITYCLSFSSITYIELRYTYIYIHTYTPCKVSVSICTLYVYIVYIYIIIYIYIVCTCLHNIQYNIHQCMIHIICSPQVRVSRLYHSLAARLPLSPPPPSLPSPPLPPHRHVASSLHPRQSRSSQAQELCGHHCIQKVWWDLDRSGHRRARTLQYGKLRSKVWRYVRANARIYGKNICQKLC